MDTYGTYGHVKESLIMMKEVIDCALDAFIRSNPNEISIFLDTNNPRDLSEAFSTTCTQRKGRSIQRNQGAPFPHTTSCNQGMTSPIDHVRRALTIGK